MSLVKANSLKHIGFEIIQGIFLNLRTFESFGSPFLRLFRISAWMQSASSRRTLFSAREYASTQKAVFPVWEFPKIRGT